METMIATSLFIIIVMSGMGALMNANRLHQKSQDMRSILDNLSFVMEEISRHLRVGYNYHCFEMGDAIPGTEADLPKSCENGVGISFQSTIGGGGQWTYFIGGDGRVYKSVDGSIPIPLTTDEVHIDIASAFSVLGAEIPAADGSGDKQQPFVTIRLVGSITSKDGIVTPFKLQTSVSHRLVDVTRDATQP